MSHGPQALQLALNLVYNICIDNKPTATLPKEIPLLILFLHPMFDHALVSNMIADIKTIHIVVVIIIGFQSQNTYRTCNRIKH